MKYVQGRSEDFHNSLDCSCPPPEYDNLPGDWDRDDDFPVYDPLNWDEYDHD